MVKNFVEVRLCKVEIILQHKPSPMEAEMYQYHFIYYVCVNN